MTGFVLAGLAIWLMLGFVMHHHGQRRLAAKRPSPTRREFLELLAGSVDENTAKWLWDQAGPYYEPLTPHPDDLLSEDAKIDDGDWSMDWPKGWDVTIRNFGKWLDMGKAAGA